MSQVVDFATYQQLCDVIVEEGASLDEQRWDDWLSLYLDDAVVWMPTWDSEFELTKNPASELSFFYLKGKHALSDRMWRWTSGQAPAAMPLPRTSHLVGHIRVLRNDPGEAVLAARWHTQVYRKKQTWSYAGSYRHTLRLLDGKWRIAEKYIVLTNDQIDTSIDLYHV